ncbi:hypothetical protein BDZ91DRAFT_725378 [Kalaharituber pfeilii]|nr:hypothetical protein BDZ91DRAFT_725378 [Kalaharituber pfeilii]
MCPSQTNPDHNQDSIQLRHRARDVTFHADLTFFSPPHRLFIGLDSRPLATLGTRDSPGTVLLAVCICVCICISYVNAGALSHELSPTASEKIRPDLFSIGSIARDRHWSAQSMQGMECCKNFMG